MAATSSASSNGVSPYGPSQVSVSRMYSTCVSSWRVPLMKVTAERTRRPGNASSAPRPFCTVITAAPGQWPSRRAAAASSSVVFVATIASSGSGSSAGSVEARSARDEVAPARDAQPVLVQRSGVLLAAAEHRDLGDAAEVAGEEAADHAGADYADAVDAVLRRASSPRRASSRGSSRQSDPVELGVREDLQVVEAVPVAARRGSGRTRRRRRRAARGRSCCGSARASRRGGRRGSGRGGARSARAARARGATCRTAGRRRRLTRRSALPPRPAS